MSPLIMNGDILIVDRSVKITSGNIFVVNFEGQLLCKRYFLRAGVVTLTSENSLYRPIVVQNPDEFSFFGAVTAIARDMREK